MNDQNPQNKPQKPLRKAIGFGIKPQEWLISTALGLSSGMATTVRTIYAEFKADIKRATIFQPHFVGMSEKEWTKLEEFDRARFGQRPLGISEPRWANFSANQRGKFGVRPEHMSEEDWNFLPKEKRDNLAERPTGIPEKEWNAFSQEERSKRAERPEGRAARLDKIALVDYKMADGTPDPDAYDRAISAEKRLHNAELNELELKYRHIRPNIFLGTLDRYKKLSPDSKKALRFNGAVGAVVGAAMTLSFFNSVATRRKIDQIAEKTGADDTFAPEQVTNSPSTIIHQQAPSLSKQAGRLVEKDLQPAVGMAR